MTVYRRAGNFEVLFEHDEYVSAERGEWVVLNGKVWGVDLVTLCPQDDVCYVDLVEQQNLTTKILGIP